LRVLAGGPQCIEEGILENVSLELGRKERANGKRIASFGIEESDASRFVVIGDVMRRYSGSQHSGDERP
jgi:hypothetical protein